MYKLLLRLSHLYSRTQKSYSVAGADWSQNSGNNNQKTQDSPSSSLMSALSTVSSLPSLSSSCFSATSRSFHYCGERNIGLFRLEDNLLQVR